MGSLSTLKVASAPYVRARDLTHSLTHSRTTNCSNSRYRLSHGTCRCSPTVQSNPMSFSFWIRSAVREVLADALKRRKCERWIEATGGNSTAVQT